MSFQDREKRRLAAYARDRWDIPNHVLPYALADQGLYEGIRTSALEYFDRYAIKWWTSRWDARVPDDPPRPTGNLTSSQVACVNHLEPARVDQQVAARVVANIDPTFSPALVDDGYVAYEWIGADSYLGEPGRRVRGANVTSLDAVMCGDRHGERVLLAFEWKYLERYGDKPTTTSQRGTDRVAIYRPLLEHPNCPIVATDFTWLFYEPYDQLMRQTLLAWQMATHGEFGADDWLHVHVVPEGNVALRDATISAPQLPGASMGDKWRSALREPWRYHLVTPSDLVAGVGHEVPWADWRRWIREFYLT